jgi:hypothetical protein
VGALRNLHRRVFGLIIGKMTGHRDAAVSPCESRLTSAAHELEFERARMAHRVAAHKLGEQIGSDENRRDERGLSPNVLRNCSVLNVREANQSVMSSSGVRNVGTGSLCPGPLCDRINVVSHRAKLQLLM